MSAASGAAEAETGADPSGGAEKEVASTAGLSGAPPPSGHKGLDVGVFKRSTDNLINNNPVPSGCDHKNCGTYNVPVDGGSVDFCNFCHTAVVVHED